jgi:secondary thiamine-phosphate synthase enzyme
VGPRPAGYDSRVILTVSSTRHKECIEITEAVREVVRGAGVTRGLCHVMALHATAAVVVNENDDPNIGVDLLRALDRAIPDHAGWLHDRVDDNAQAHIKAAILGPSETVPIVDGDLALGTWQGILVVELDGPRAGRRVLVTIVPAA